MNKRRRFKQKGRTWGRKWRQWARAYAIGTIGHYCTWCGNCNDPAGTIAMLRQFKESAARSEGTTIYFTAKRNVSYFGLPHRPEPSEAEVMARLKKWLKRYEKRKKDWTAKTADAAQRLAAG